MCVLELMDGGTYFFCASILQPAPPHEHNTWPPVEETNNSRISQGGMDELHKQNAVFPLKQRKKGQATDMSYTL